MTYLPADHAPPMWDHQRRIFEQTAHLKYWALWCEQRTGKTRIILDTAAYQYEAGLIDALIVGAYPSNVHRNWVIEEIPAYLPHRIPHKAIFWRSGRAGNKVWEQDLLELMHFRGLAILTFNCEALTRSHSLWPYLQKFCHKRKVMAVADESNWLASPNAARSKRAEALGRRAVTSRIASGTPVDESPFDVFAQCHFLHRGILGFEHALAFRNRYGAYELEINEETGEPIIDTDTGLPKRAKKYNHKTNHFYETQTGYQNLEELNEKILSFGSRVLRSECADLPDKIYRKMHFDLAPEQRRAYDELRDRYRTELAGGTVQVVHPLTRLGRLQMVGRGYWPEETVGRPCGACEGAGCDECEGIGIVVVKLPRQLIPAAKNPAIEVLTDELLALKAPALVWCRYRWDVTDAFNAAEAAGRKPVRYDGSVKPDQRATNLKQFQSGQADTFVGTAAVGGRGIRIDLADAIIYYSNSFSLLDRRQSEDRAESLTMTRGTGVIDLIARDTVDEHIVDTLRNKKSIAEIVLGDPKMSWI